jgi:hypothetical protein
MDGEHQAPTRTTNDTTTTRRHGRMVRDGRATNKDEDTRHRLPPTTPWATAHGWKRGALGRDDNETRGWGRRGDGNEGAGAGEGVPRDVIDVPWAISEFFSFSFNFSLLTWPLDSLTYPQPLPRAPAHGAARQGPMTRHHDSAPAPALRATAHGVNRGRAGGTGRTQTAGMTTALYSILYFIYQIMNNFWSSVNGNSTL